MTNTKTLTLTVGADVTYEQAVAALAAAGLPVEGRAPIALYVSEDGHEPLYSVVEDYFGDVPGRQCLSCELGMLAELVDTGYANIVDELHLRALQHDSIREELLDKLRRCVPESVTVAGFANGVASRPLFVVDGLTIAGDLTKATRDRYARSFTIGTAVDAAAARSIALIADNETGTVVAQSSPVTI